MAHVSYRSQIQRRVACPYVPGHPITGGGCANAVSPASLDRSLPELAANNWERSRFFPEQGHAHSSLGCMLAGELWAGIFWWEAIDLPIDARPPVNRAAATQCCSACFSKPVPMSLPAQFWSVASCPGCRRGDGSSGCPVRMLRGRRSGLIEVEASPW